MHLQGLRYLAVALTAAACLEGSLANGDDLAYALTPTSGTTASFGVVDLNTGAFNVVSPEPFYPTGLAEYNDALFASDNAGKLYNINPTSGTITQVESVGPTLGVVASTTSGIFGVNSNLTDLYSIDPNTGTSTLIGPLGVSARTTAGLSVGAGQLYLNVSSPGDSSLYVLNTDTGAATLIGSNASGGGCLKSLTYEDSLLYAISGYCTTSSDVFTLNTTNGSATFVATVPAFEGDLDGLAPLVNTPEPATWSLITGALLVAGLIRRRRSAL